MAPYRSSLLACCAIFAMTATNAHASVDNFAIAGNDRSLINLEVCSAETQLAVRGNAGTDLDFSVTDQSERTLYDDVGIDDYFSFVINGPDNGECETFYLLVSNLAESDSEVTVVLKPLTDNSARVSKYIVPAGENEAFEFKACGTSAKVTARGDGDTDVDYIIRNADGAIVHEDDDLSDETSAVLVGLLADCELFEIEVTNMGQVYNAIMLMVSPQGAPDEPFEGTAPSATLGQVPDGFINGVGRRSQLAETSGPGDYRVDANVTLSVSVPVCGASRMEIRGDGDTDLDFTIFDESGETVFSDFDLTDLTYATLAPSSQCETYLVEVANLGDTNNDFTISLVDMESLPEPAVSEQYRLDGDAFIKVPLRICDATKIAADGDGRTDLDFIVTNQLGETIHSDLDLTDHTQFLINAKDGSTCGNYQMVVRNIGDGPNNLTVTFDADVTAEIEDRPDRGPLSVKSAAANAASPGVGETDGQDRSIAILNRTGEDLTLIYWTNSATLGWGNDKLGDASILSRGQQWNVNVNDGSEACLFDFKAVTQSEREISVTSVNVCSEANVAFD